VRIAKAALLKGKEFLEDSLSYALRKTGQWTNTGEAGGECNYDCKFEKVYICGP
jgi:hypothetical protein